MGRSRRSSRPKVRIGLPKKKGNCFKPAFAIPDQLLNDSSADAAEVAAKPPEWDEKGSAIKNYKSFGVVSNPNLLGARARTPHMVVALELQIPRPTPPGSVNEFDPIDSGSDLESDDLKSALGKRRKDGKCAPLQRLTTIQRVHIGRLVDKYGEDYKAMFMDTKLNAMQHSPAVLKKLCERYFAPPAKLYIKLKK